MTGDQELVKQIQQHLQDIDLEKPCAFHAERGLVYDEHKRLTHLHLCGRLQFPQLRPMIPSAVWQCSSLQELDLTSNRPLSLPADLQELDLTSNRLLSLPAELGQLTSLRVLFLDSNLLHSLPAELWLLSSLQVLNLSVNQLTSLPAELGQLTSLEELNLSYNRLTSLPAELGQLTSLRVLNLSYNRLTSLPAELGQLTSLRVLELDGNRLTSLPSELGQLTSLRRLALYKNPLPSPFLDIREGVPTTLMHLRTQLPATIPAGAEAQTSIQAQPQILPAGTSEERNPSPAPVPRPIKIFYCYAHKDRDLRDRIDAHLGVLKRLGQVTGWYDREIQAGTEWEREIEAHLSTASIILLLVSADFVNSDYCYGMEMQRALEMHEKGEAHVLPILLRPVDWRNAPFAKLQLLPAGAKPITSWSDQEEAFKDVAEHIRAVVTTLRTR